jgi:ABC-type multidrug transport system fused ATPase/permease subunit
MKKFKESPLLKSINVLSSADRKKVLGITFLQILMGILDLIGVAAIGLLGAISVSGMQSKPPSVQLFELLRFLGIENYSFQSQAVFLSVIALIVLIARTGFSIFFTRKILFFLSRRGASISANLVSKLLAQPLLMLQSRTTQELLYNITSGVQALVLQVLASAAIFLSDMSLLLVIAIALFIVDPLTSMMTFTVFLFIGFALYKLMHIRAGKLGAITSKLNIESNEKIIEVFSSYRESVVRNRRGYYSNEIASIRTSLAHAAAEMAFQPFVSKYVIETTVVAGAFLVGGIQLVINDSSHAVATLAIFLAAGSRIAPAVLRLQQGSISIKSGLGISAQTLELIEALKNTPEISNSIDKLDLNHSGFNPEILVKNVSLQYPNTKSPAVSRVGVRIPAGSLVAFVGPSGAGKTTVIDILLGILDPDEGNVEISGHSPLSAISKWPGAISYVPQDISIASGTIKENIGLGYPPHEVSEDLVLAALRTAKLEDFVLSLPEGLNTQVGERGTRLSGGQRQRLGIARAMFTKPRLLVLDEATSSLDGETESHISDAIKGMHGSITVVIIAHRLSTIQNADSVIYLDKGKVLGTGTFEEVRTNVPQFAVQVSKMGL